MATKVEGFPPTERGDGKYPWNTWGDGNIWKLVKGKDFDTPIASMRQTVAKAARRRNTTATTRAYKRDGEESLYIQFNVEAHKPKGRGRGKSGA